MGALRDVWHELYGSSRSVEQDEPPPRIVSHMVATAEGYVDLGGGLEVPVEVTIEAAREDWPYDIELVAEIRDGRYVCTSFTCRESDAGDPVTTDGLRSLPVAEIMRSGLVLHLDEFIPKWPGGGRPPPSGPTDEALREAAAVYRLAYAIGDAPTKAVADVMDLTHSTAARWVATARDKGFLGETTQGKPGA